MWGWIIWRWFDCLIIDLGGGVNVNSAFCPNQTKLTEYFVWFRFALGLIFGLGRCCKSLAKRVFGNSI